MVVRSGPLQAIDITTEPYPGFPTDLQAQFMALMTIASGASVVRETVYESRFMHVPELGRLGANIRCKARRRWCVALRACTAPK